MIFCNKLDTLITKINYSSIFSIRGIGVKRHLCSFISVNATLIGMNFEYFFVNQIFEWYF